jgi:hypothetical protein
MPCLVVDVPGGGRAIVKLAAPRRKFCPFCKAGVKRYVTKLCDYPLPFDPKQTCDAGMCDRHAFSVAPNVDYCPNHKPAEASHGK